MVGEGGVGWFEWSKYVDFFCGVWRIMCIYRLRYFGIFFNNGNW